MQRRVAVELSFQAGPVVSSESAAAGDSFAHIRKVRSGKRLVFVVRLQAVYIEVRLAPEVRRLSRLVAQE